MPKPNLIIAGPPKTGTTSIFEWLSNHPDAHPSRVKETYYFYDTANEKSPFPNFNKDGWDNYQKLFKGWNGQKIIFEASPGYIYSKLAAEKLGEIQNIKVIVIYRDYADRLFSEYQFTRYKTRNFDDSFAEYLGYDGKHFTSPQYKKIILRPYLNYWLKHIREDQLKIIKFEDLKQDPKTVMQKLSDFIKIDRNFYESFAFNRKNETFVLRYKKTHYFLIKSVKYIPEFVQKLLIPAYYFFNKTKVPPITSEEAYLKKTLSEYVKKEEELFFFEFQKFFI